MKKRVIIVHGWSGSPNDDWLPWVKQELEKKGFEVIVPAMPDPDYPKIETWVSHLAQIVGKSDENTILIGHSIGCQTILRYLQTLPEDQKVGQVILVAGWFNLTPQSFESPEDEEIAKPWVIDTIDFNKIRNKAKSFLAILSDNDPYVPLEQSKKIFEQKLGARIIIEHNMGHFSQDNGITSLPIILEVVK